MFTLFDLDDDASESASSPAASPAKTSRWLESVLALLENGAGFGGSSIGSSGNSLPPSFSLKTSLVCCPQTGGETSRRSSIPWLNSGMGGPTGFLTLSSTECHNAAAVSSLSDVLEAAPTVPRKYFLSPTACRGILRRAAKRGRELPPALQRALQAVAESADQGDDGKTT